MKSARNTIGTILLLGSTSCLVWFFWPQPVTAPKLELVVTESDVSLDPHTLSIPSLGVSAPLVYTTVKEEAAFQEALQRGVVHFPGTALPGTKGNAYFFGHSSDYAWAKGEYKTVFALLPSITVGTDVYISTAEENVFHYRIRETRIVEPDDLSVLAQGEEFLLTLQTSYPVGTAKQRFLAIAELVP